MEVPNSEGLGGLLSQHLQELDESMALLTSRPVGSGGFLREARQAPVPAAVAAPEPPALAPRLTAPPVAQPVSLESLLRGIETQQLSVAEALSNLEQSPAPAPVPVAPAAPAPAPAAQRCEGCAVLGLQIRALSQSLAGLSASMVRWSEQLHQGRQKEVADMVLDYLQPLKQVDSRLEMLVLELRQDLAQAALGRKGAGGAARGGLEPVAWHLDLDARPLRGFAS